MLFKFIANTTTYVICKNIKHNMHFCLLLFMIIYVLEKWDDKPKKHFGETKENMTK